MTASMGIFTVLASTLDGFTSTFRRKENVPDSNWLSGVAAEMCLQFVTALGKIFFNERELTLLWALRTMGSYDSSAQPIRDDG